MLSHYLPLLNSKNIILASQSYGRQDLLKQQGIRYKIVVSKFEEDLDKSMFGSKIDYVRETCR